MNGKTIEVINTDAEGRLVLADALWYAREQGATHLLDLATLTGAMELALGDLYAGVFANDDAWRDQVVEAGEASGDHAWPLPLHRRYRRYVNSNFADMKNASILRQGSPALAAEFLREFAGEGPWAHIDMAGPGFLDPLARRLPDAAGRYGLRRPADRRARRAARRMNFDLSPEHELDPRHRARVRARAGRAGRRGARPRAPLPLRARRRAGRARADGHPDSRGVRRRAAATRSRTRSRSRS